MPYANPEDKRRRERERYRANPGYYKRKCQRARRNNPKLHAYLQQKSRAKARGVDWEITFDEWVKWWGDDFDLRGRRRNELQMCRYDDVGPYKIGNIYKATQEENDHGPRPFPECPF